MRLLSEFFVCHMTKPRVSVGHDYPKMRLRGMSLVTVLPTIFHGEGGESRKHQLNKAMILGDFIEWILYVLSFQCI